MKGIDILDILLIILTCSIIFIWYRSTVKCSNINKNQNEKFNSTNTKNKKYKQNKKINTNNIYAQDLDINIFEDKNIKNNKKTKIISQPSLKSHFIEMQFHNDYRDTITSFNDIAPSQKEIFNESDSPVTHSNPSHKEVLHLIKEFIKQLNKNVKHNVSDYRNSNTGWDEPLPEPNERSGWDKQQDELGLPSSLYANPAKKASVKLVTIDEVEKQSTEFETKYICTIIIQKINVEDQMVVKITFVQDNRNINSDRKFFKDLELDTTESNHTNNSTFNIVIEQIFIVGFLTNEGVNEGNKEDDFYNFKGLETNDVICDKTIMKELIKKHKCREIEDLKFAASLGEEGRLFHDELRDVSSYEAFKCTRSIYDDLNGKEIIYE